MSVCMYVCTDRRTDRWMLNGCVMHDGCVLALLPSGHDLSSDVLFTIHQEVRQWD